MAIFSTWQIESHAKNSTVADNVEQLNARIKEVELQRDLAKQCADNANIKLDSAEGILTITPHTVVWVL